MELDKLYTALEPKSPGQRSLKEALESDKDLVGVFGPTGTGKSLFSISYGIYSIYKGKYKRLILARPVIDVATGREITITSDPETYRKMSSEYLYDVLSDWATPEAINKLMAEGKLVLADPHFLRGRTFDNSIMVLDDVQGVAPETVVEAITRLGRNSRLIIAGDPIFQRQGFEAESALLARDILVGEETAVVVDLGLKDVVRPGAKRGIKLLFELQMRRRKLDDVEKSVMDSIKIHAPDADVVTVVNLQDAKRKWNVDSEHVPDSLIIVKEGHLGRLIGTGGQRIASIESDTGLKLRAIQLTLDFKELVRAIHPVSWIHKHVQDFDFAGMELRLVVAPEYMGPMMGQRGIYVKFMDEVFNKLMGVNIYVVEGEPARRRRR
ncbi:MAG: PhoH family protein [Desulfurococcales archaeon]|nr:PhoH family protein [Desulfurococcales archaeon]